MGGGAGTEAQLGCSKPFPEELGGRGDRRKRARLCIIWLGHFCRPIGGHPLSFKPESARPSVVARQPSGARTAGTVGRRLPVPAAEQEPMNGWI